MPKTMVSSDWDSGNLVFSDPDGDILLTLNGKNGGIITKSSSAVLATTESHCVIIASTDGITLTLPAVATSIGIRYIIKVTATHSDGVVVDGNASETIDGSTSKTSGAQYNILDIICDGLAWHIIGKYGTWS